MPPTEEERRYGVGLVVDCCSDIRAVYGALKLRSEKEKLGEVEELEEEQDTKALLALEEDLDLHYDTLCDLGMSHDEIREIVSAILPPDRYQQLIKRKDAVHA